MPVEPGRPVLDDHAVLLRGNRIADVLPTSDALARYPEAARLELADHVLTPGLVNLHTHSAMALMRGLADDLPLMTWLKSHVWPAEAKHVSADFVRDGTLLACAEMLRSGVTCFNDMYFFPRAAAEAVDRTGLRAAIGMIAVEFPTAYAADAEDYLRKGLEVRDEFRDHPRLSFCMAPHAPYTVSDRTFEKVLMLADQTNVPIHLHLHETLEELSQSVADFGLRPLARLQRLGLLNPGLIAVHMVHLTEEEIALCAQYGVSIAHCPTSNLKLGSGIAPIAHFAAAGINVGLGTDGAASNNRLDLLGEVRLAALLAKGTSMQATALPAHEALAMATLNGAKALGLDHEIGSIAVGKAADLVALDLSSIETSPCYDVVSHLVYACGREHVTHVWVDGELLLEERRLTRLDEAAVRANALQWRDRLRVQ